nr:MAG: DNA pilot protein [Microvirus sp.]
MPLGAFLAGAAPVIGDLLGGILSDKGQKSANKTNIKIAREQMAFQERMSNSAYQRATEDLSKSGLNRILALGSPASSPAGASAIMQNEKAGIGSGVKSATSSAMSAKLIQSQLGLVNSQTLNTTANARLAEQKTKTEQELTEINSAKKIIELRNAITAQGITDISNPALKMLNLLLEQAQQKTQEFTNNYKYDPTDVKSADKPKETNFTRKHGHQ